MHNAAFAALGLDWVFVAFPTPAGRGNAAVRAALDLGLAGLNVTMPHKADAAAACDDLSPDSAALDAVNTVVVDGAAGRVTGHNTDGEGFLRALADEQVSVAGSRVLVVGAGGAARAIARALGNAGASVTVAARRLERAQAAARLAGGAAVQLGRASVEDFDVIVNATPVGMQGEAPPVDAERLLARQFVYDTIYPVETPLLEAARAGGVRCAGGLGMLVHQGALAFELWTGSAAPVDVMRAAALA
jgi:shikimate dehydrogenase